jgi:hypothetical protein
VEDTSSGIGGNALTTGEMLPDIPRRILLSCSMTMATPGLSLGS